MFAFVIDVCQGFLAATPLEKIGFLLSLTGISTVSGWLYSVFRRRNNRSLISALKQDNAALEAERRLAERKAEEEHERARLWMPHEWMEDALKAQGEGQEEKAILRLRDGFERVRDDLARTCLALAGHHLCLTVGPEARMNLSEGERLARLAALLDPTDSDAAFLVEEAALMRADEGGVLDVEFSYLPEDQGQAMAAIDAILSQAAKHLASGRVHVGYRLTRRAVLILRAAGLTRQLVGLVTEREHARFAFHSGRGTEALASLENLLHVHGKSIGLTAPEMLITRLLEVEILGIVGGPHRAVGKAQRLLPELKAAFGRDHFATLSCRFFEVRALVAPGGPKQPLSKIRSLLQDLDRVFGPNNPNSLSLRNLEARALLEMGEAGQALEIVRSVREAESGAGLPEHHPNVLAGRFQEAAALERLGRYVEALQKARSLLQDHERVLGEHHLDTLATRHLEAAALYGIGEYKTALAKVEDLLQIRESLLGAQHPQVEVTRRLEARIRNKM